MNTPAGTLGGGLAAPKSKSRSYLTMGLLVPMVLLALTFAFVSMFRAQETHVALTASTVASPVMPKPPSSFPKPVSGTTTSPPMATTTTTTTTTSTKAPTPTTTTATTSTTSPQFVYTVVIDAGSTGSRVHTYKFDASSATGSGADTKSSPSSLVLESDDFHAIKPGLSAYPDDPDEAANSLRQLLDLAKEAVPQDQWASTPVEVRATAGLRLLGADKADAILTRVKMMLREDYAFAVVDDAVSILDGKQEAAFAWLSLNYLLGTVTKDPEETKAMIDLGGGSVQLAYALPTTDDQAGTSDADGNDDEVTKDYVQTLQAGGQKFAVYVHSWLGYGLMAARAQVLATHEGQPGPADSSDKLPAWRDGDSKSEPNVPHPCFMYDATTTEDEDEDNKGTDTGTDTDTGATTTTKTTIATNVGGVIKRETEYEYSGKVYPISAPQKPPAPNFKATEACVNVARLALDLAEECPNPKAASKSPATSMMTPPSVPSTTTTTAPLNSTTTASLSSAPRCLFNGAWGGPWAEHAARAQRQDGTSTPAPFRDVYLMSYFMDRAENSGLVSKDDKSKTIKAGAFKEKAEGFCEQHNTLKDVMQEAVGVEDAVNANFLCQDLVTQHVLLADGFKIHDDADVTLVRALEHRSSTNPEGEDIEVTWTLGAAINTLERHAAKWREP